MYGAQKIRVINFRNPGINAIVLLFILFFGINSFSSNSHASTNENTITPKTSAYNEFPAGLSCSSDACFTGNLLADITSAGGTLSGSGTQGDPYIIENFNITNAGTGINIYRTTKHIKIRNNYINASTAIFLSETSGTITVENNNITSPDLYGVRAKQFNASVIVKDNYFHNIQQSGGYALELGTDNPGLGHGIVNTSIVYNNTFVGNYRGIIVSYSNYTSIYNNTIMDTQDFALSAVTTDKLYIYNNTVSNAAAGLRFTSSNNYTLAENNTVTDIGQYPAMGQNYWDQYTPRIIRNNWIENVDNIGIAGSNNATIVGNTLINIGASPIYTGHNATVKDNTISNYGNIEANSYGISVQWNSTVRNNVISGSGTGISVANNSIVQDNQISDVLGSGILITEGILTATGNTVTRASLHGVDLQNSHGGSIVNSNTIEDVKQNGIRAYWSTGVTMGSNTITNSGGSGIYLESASGADVSSNTVSGSKVFSVTSLSSPSKFTSNTFENEVAINLNTGYTQTREAFFAYEFTSNTVHGLPFGYYENATADISTQHGQLYIINAENIIVTNNNFANQKIPITVVFSVGVTLQSLTLTNNSYYGVYSHGIASKVDIVDSTIQKTHGTGVISEGAINLVNSEVIENHGNGLYISLNSIVWDSEISRNEGIGLLISYRSNGVTVHDNLFDSNEGYAVAVEIPPSFSVNQNARIHHNNFINNNGGGVQALDNGSNNQWYDFTTMEGNYWDDWSGSGAYLLDGTATNEDPYPIGTQIAFPRTVPQTTTTNTAGTDPTNTEPSDTFTPTSPSDEVTKAGFLPSPSISILGIMLMYFVTNIRTRKMRKQ